MNIIIHTMKWNLKQAKKFVMAMCLFLFVYMAPAQVTSSIDSTSIKIGEQITFEVTVEADTTDLVLFPEGQTFLPLELIESYDIDTTNKSPKYYLIKKYGLTQFDSGSYTIPRQKIIVGAKTFFTDSLQVEVNNVEVDTTKQKLYDIKPVIEVDKSIGNWWKYVIAIILILGLIAFLIYWFVWREKPLSKEDKIALLPPYERAKIALQELDEARYLENDEIKAYYSELTLIIRKYLDEKVYDHSLESTTEELVNRLQLLKDANHIDLDKDTIHNIETIFKRADLVKFAKSQPDIELAKLDRNTIDLEIDHVKESLPEPTEEERLADLKYQEELERKKKRKRILITTVIAAFILIGTVVGFTIHYGFDYVKDSIFGHPTKELLESKEWVTSEYGAPGITITTPKVLERLANPELPEELKENVKMVFFGYGSLIDQFYVAVSTAKYNPEMLGENKIDLNNAVDGSLKAWESQGVQNIISRSEQFITPNGQEGLKVYGKADFPDLVPGQMDKGEYVILVFTTENILQQIVLKWKEDDVYADQIIDRILNSVELLKLEEKDQ